MPDNVGTTLSGTSVFSSQNGVHMNERSAPSGFAAVRRDPIGRRLLTVQALSELGDFVGLSALMLLTYARTGSVLGPAAVFAARTVPSLLVGTAFSGWLDRPPRRAALVTMALFGAVVVGTVALVPTLVVALTAAALLGASRTAYLSVSTGAVADAVPVELRGRFYALSSTINQSAQVIGFVGGTSATLVFGSRASLGFDAVTFVVGAMVLRRLPYLAPHVRDRRPSPLEGLRTIRAIPTLRWLAPVVWVSALGTALPETVAPHLAHGSGELPLVMGAAPFGMMVGALLLGRKDFFVDVRRQFLCAALLAGAFASGTAVVAITSAAWPLIIVNLLVGAGTAWEIGARATFASKTPPERMAQVQATMVASITAIEGVGVLGIGLLMTVIGPWVGYGLVAIPLALTTLPRLARRREWDVEEPLAVIELSVSLGGDAVGERERTVVLTEHGGSELDDAMVECVRGQPAQ